ncbi:MAG TPA: DUF2891 domain-containing protein [Magnetospirillaceae bacterium]|jgi:hypothetical protein
MPASLTAEIASRFAKVALGHVTREYPYRLDHVVNGPGDVQSPKQLHPIFYGSFDWHSCAHGYWLLASLYRRFPNLPEAGAIRTVIDAHVVPEKVAVEAASFGRPNSGSFERPYGWAWVLALAAELARHTTPEGKKWREAFAPLARMIAEKFVGFWPKQTYPIRVGTHYNSAFAMVLALDYAAVVKDTALDGVLRERARAWFSNDADCQAWEPGGDEFLSSALMEAACMREVLQPTDFAPWFVRFLPHLKNEQPATLFTPATVSDRSDGKIAHLDGLSLSRAWCFRMIAGAFAETDALGAALRRAADRHLDSALPHVAGDYAGEHWLATFALLALAA